MTFQIGDRVKAKEDTSVYLTCDKVYAIANTKYDGHQVEVLADTKRLAWLHAHRFELYAKAGEFVVGDQVIVTKDGEDDAPTGAMFTVTGTGRGYEDRQTVDFTDNVGDGREWLSDRFRLATPEEIAAADLAAPKFSEIDPSIVIEPKPFGKFFTILGEPDTGSQAIPAADFDFSTIKTGDEIVVACKVASDGLDKDGEVRVEGRSGFFRYFKPDQITSVIRAPKPKTLRERAIEAAMRVASQGAVPTTMIVDAVLAEVEKGR